MRQIRMHLERECGGLQQKSASCVRRVVTGRRQWPLYRGVLKGAKREGQVAAASLRFAKASKDIRSCHGTAADAATRVDRQDLL
jgi:hypothetical protein